MSSQPLPTPEPVAPSESAEGSLPPSRRPHPTAQLGSGPRLLDQVVVLTGAAGNIGSFIARQLLREGAKLVMTGRSQEKLETFVDALVSEGFERDRMLPVAADAADPEACRRVVTSAVERFGPIDALLNNAGAAGPKMTLENIPFTEAETRETGQNETMLDAAKNLLGGPWNMVRAAVPHLAVGASIVNVSTIFSRTPYYGRIPYVVPKSGLNALSLGLARELGLTDKGIRVNTVFPGPIESERIETVFAAMDKLQEQPAGSTAKMFKELMILKRPTPPAPAGTQKPTPVATDGGNGSAGAGDEVKFRYPTPTDVASTVLWLASKESSAFSGHSFEVTNGMQVPAQSRSKLVSWPDRRLVDLRDKVVLILAGRNIKEAVAFTEKHREFGAEVVLAFRDLPSLERARAKMESADARPLPLILLNPARPETVERSMQFLEDRYGRLDGVVVLPSTPNPSWGHELSTMTDEQVDTFLQDEIVSPVAFASSIAKLLRKWTSLDRAPAITFVTNEDDGHDNRLNEVNRAAIEELLRVWRFEEEHDVRVGRRPWGCRPNQLVRFSNHEPENLAFCCDWAATLTNRVRIMEPINLWVPEKILLSTGKSAMPLGIQRVLPGLHHGKTAVVTGASGGIGYQLGRYLAMAGVRVLLSARNEEKLEEARRSIVDELKLVGYPEPEQRVFALANIDVGDEAALDELFQHSVELFGSVDFLINNAGIAGAEEMVVDMSLDAWNRTLEANLISNYSLIRKYTPLMKRNGHGKILNVSSYFGGEKYLAVAYPNRSDYSVSKAGQRALAEIMSRHLGPEIQINSLAPGPVEGERLRGTPDRPGLFARRGRLILENKRLNAVHEAILETRNAGFDPVMVLDKMAKNRVAELEAWADAPPPIAVLLKKIKRGHPGKVSTQHVMSGVIAPKLLERLHRGGIVDKSVVQPFLDAFEDGPVPFFDREEVAVEADKIQQGIIDRLHLHRMPTDEQVALSTVFYLADVNVSGDAFHPSGGLKFERSVTEGELLLKPSREHLTCLKGQNVVVIGEAMKEGLGELVKAFASHGVAHVALLTETDDAAREIVHRAGSLGQTKVTTHLVGEELESALIKVAENAECGVHTVVSTPFPRLPLNPLSAEATSSAKEWERVLSRDEFAEVLDDHITHHFRVGRIAALWPGCQIVLVTPDTSRASTREEFALALFVKNALHAFTVTLGVESERLPTVPAVSQVQLTRRARTEEPGTESELKEELDRFVAAVLKCAIPSPSPKESRYLSRIYRGNALTV